MTPQNGPVVDLFYVQNLQTGWTIQPLTVSVSSINGFISHGEEICMRDSYQIGYSWLFIYIIYIYIYTYLYPYTYHSLRSWNPWSTMTLPLLMVETWRTVQWSSRRRAVTGLRRSILCTWTSRRRGGPGSQGVADMVNAQGSGTNLHILDRKNTWKYALELNFGHFQ